MKKVTLKIAILSIASLNMSATAVSPLFADISRSYPEASVNRILSIVTVPAIAVILFSLLSGKLATLLGKRNLLLLSLVFFLIGGIGPVFTGNLAMILILRGILGAGIGLFMPISNSIIVDFYDGDERISMFGYQSTLGNIGTMVLGFAAGIIGSINWHLAFWVYILGLVALLLTFFFIPKNEVNQPTSKEKIVFSPKFYQLSFLIALFFMLMFAFFANISNIIVGDHIGTAALAGTVIALFNVGGILSGVILGKLLKRLKSLTVEVILGLTGLGFVILSFTHSIVMMMIAAAFIGFGFGVIVPYTILQINASVQKTSVTHANAIFLCVTNLGVFLSPFIFSFIGLLFGNETARFNLLFTAVCLFVACLGAFMLKLKKRIST